MAYTDAVKFIYLKFIEKFKFVVFIINLMINWKYFVFKNLCFVVIYLLLLIVFFLQVRNPTVIYSASIRNNSLVSFIITRI